MTYKIGTLVQFQKGAKFFITVGEPYNLEGKFGIVLEKVSGAKKPQMFNIYIQDLALEGVFQRGRHIKKVIDKSHEEIEMNSVEGIPTGGKLVGEIDS